MIDYLKISTTDFDHQSLLRHPKLNFKGWTDLETSEIESNKYGNKKYVSYLHNLKIVVYENESGKFTLVISGSIHKFYNNGKHNYNDFNFSDIIETIEHLAELLYFNPENSTIKNLEIGVNLIPPIKTKKILAGLLSHRNNRFKSYSYPDAEFFQVLHSNFILKIYDKAKQYKSKKHLIHSEILRIELKYTKMMNLIKILKSRGIIDKNFLALSDLKNANVLVAFGELLLIKWNEILLYDFTISKKHLKISQLKKLTVWQNINQWENFTKQKKLKEKNQLYKIIKNHSQQIQFQVSNLIKEKLKELIQKGLPINQYFNSKKGYQLTTFKANIEKRKGLPINSIYKEEIGNSFEDFFSNKNPEEIRANYELWINDSREIPF